MPRYWIGVVAANHAVVAEHEGVCGLSLGGREAIAGLDSGDIVVLYAPRTGFRSGARVQAFVGIATIDGAALWKREWVDDGQMSWVRGANYRENLVPAPIRPLLPNLSFIGDPRYWGIAFRRGLVEINWNDFNLILSSMARDNGG